MRTVEQILNQYTLPTDEIISLGFGKYEIKREGVVYFLETESIVAAGCEVKMHNRRLVKTNLPYNVEKVEKQNKVIEKIEELEEKLKISKEKKWSSMVHVQKRELDKLYTRLARLS